MLKFEQKIITDNNKNTNNQNVLDNLGKMNKFPERCKLPILTQERIENLNRSVTSNDN